MDKVTKETKSVIQMFFQGGTKCKAALAMEPSQVESEMRLARNQKRPAKLDCVDEDAEVATSFLAVHFEFLMFYNVAVPATPSSIIKVAAGSVPGSHV